MIARALFASVLTLLPLLASHPTAAEENDPASADEITLALSKLAIETGADGITDAAYDSAKTAVLDALGCAMAGHNAPGVGPVMEQMVDFGGKAEATIWFHGGTVPGPAAAFANSVQVHALDLDDVHMPSTTHITSVVVPAALAMGQLNDASGQETLAAVILGIEVAGRLGRACKSRRSSQGFLPSSIIGGFGATAAACRLQRCTVEETVNAMGIWYAHASGNRQALLDGTLTKRIQPGIAARAGTLASYLARRGLTGPRRIIAGQPASLVPIYGHGRSGAPPTVGEVMAPQDLYEIEQLSYKRFACCGASHPLMEAVLSLIDENDIQIADVAKVKIFGIDRLVRTPWSEAKNPHVLAQFCASYEVASLIENRCFGPAEITNKRIAEDRQVDSLARSVQVASWDQWNGPKTSRPSHATMLQGVQITLNDGRLLQAARHSGQALHPDLRRWPEVVEKFISNATFSGLVDQDGAQQMVEAIKQLDQCKKVRQFITSYLSGREPS